MLPLCTGSVIQFPIVNVTIFTRNVRKHGGTFIAPQRQHQSSILDADGFHNGKLTRWQERKCGGRIWTLGIVNGLIGESPDDALSKCAYVVALTYGRNYEAINPGGGGKA